MATIVKGNQKAPFSIATKPRCRGGATPFPGLLHFTLDTYLILPSVKQGGIKNHFFKVFSMTWPGIEPRSPGPLANTTHKANEFWTSINLIKNSFTPQKSRRRQYPTETMLDEDYTDDLALLTNTLAQIESPLHNLEQAERGIGL